MTILADPGRNLVLQRVVILSQTKPLQTPRRPLRIRLTMRAAMDALKEYSVLRTRDAARIIRRRNPTPNDIWVVNNSLRLLHRAGYVHRILLPSLTDKGRPYVYGLTDKGVREFGGKTFDDHSARTLDHELEITAFHIALVELCEAHSIALHWKQHDLKHGVNPDAYFTLTRDGKTRHFFLEIERAKVGNFKNGEPSIIRKFRHYYGYYNTLQCEQQWGCKTFRLVTLFPTEEKRANMLGAMRDELCHRMFWLGTMKNPASTYLTPTGDSFSFLDV